MTDEAKQENTQPQEVAPIVPEATAPVAAPEAAVPVVVSEAAASAVVPEVATPIMPQARPDPRRGYGRGRTPGNRGGQGGQNRGGRGPRRGDAPQVESEYDEKNLEINRVTRVTKGGKRMRFRALTVIGNRKGRVGYGVAKGLDVAGATAKATTQARKSLITVPMVNETIPHAVIAKFAAARVLLKPAPKGTGIKAGGAVRIVLEFAGVPNVTSKILGSSSKINNVKATFKALKMLKLPPTKPTV